MKLLKLLVLLSLSYITHSADFDLKWDPSTTSGITNYVLYASTNSLVYSSRTNAFRLNAGISVTARISDIVPDQWNFAVTAVKDGIESGFSNVLIVEVPDPPKNMRVVALQFSGTLSNFYDVGFFKLRLP